MAKKLGFHKIIDPYEIGAGGSCTYTISRYVRPAVIEPTEWDRVGNITNARIDRYHHTYFIEDTKNSLNSIINKFRSISF